MWDKKGLYYKAFWSPEFLKHKQNRQKGQSPYVIEIQEKERKNIFLLVVQCSLLSEQVKSSEFSTHPWLLFGIINTHYAPDVLVLPAEFKTRGPPLGGKQHV